ncbi:MAG TPA: hypothetical protein VN397_03185 [Candidatus Methylomirabilis sp.]|nr:hypothetical protein [Candidatus Methylomirabilis sp.]
MNDRTDEGGTVQNEYDSTPLPPLAQDLIILFWFGGFFSLVWDVLVHSFGFDPRISWLACGFTVIAIFVTGKVIECREGRGS